MKVQSYLPYDCQWDGWRCTRIAIVFCCCCCCCFHYKNEILTNPENHRFNQAINHPNEHHDILSSFPIPINTIDKIIVCLLTFNLILVLVVDVESQWWWWRLVNEQHLVTYRSKLISCALLFAPRRNYVIQPEIAFADAWATCVREKSLFPSVYPQIFDAATFFPMNNMFCIWMMMHVWK